MGQEPLFDAPEFRALKAALEEEWPQRQTALRSSGVPLNDDPDPDPQPDPAPDPKPDPEPDPQPPWGDDFDPERAWNTITKLRSREKQLATEAAEARARAQKYEDQNKTEAQKLQERAEAAEKALTEANRNALVASVALSKGLTEAQAKRLVGSTKEELEADADELLTTFAPAGQEPEGGRPRERLRPGAAPGSEPEETDPAKLAAMVPRRI